MPAMTAAIMTRRPTRPATKGILVDWFSPAVKKTNLFLYNYWNRGKTVLLNSAGKDRKPSFYNR